MLTIYQQNETSTTNKTKQIVINEPKLVNKGIELD